MKINEALKQVVAGESPESVLEKAITSANYDQRLAVNSPTTVQRGNVTINPEGFAEDHGETFDCPADYGVYPMAGTRMWPRGSHESNAQRGEPPYFKSEQLVARVVAGATPGQVLETELVEDYNSIANSVAKKFGGKARKISGSTPKTVSVDGVQVAEYDKVVQFLLSQGMTVIDKDHEETDLGGPDGSAVVKKRETLVIWITDKRVAPGKQKGYVHYN